MYVLCPPVCNADDCQNLRETIDRAVMELGADVAVTLVTDEERILSFGVLPEQTPAVVTAHYRLRSTKQVPETTAVREWIKDLMA